MLNLLSSYLHICTDYLVMTKEQLLPTISSYAMNWSNDFEFLDTLLSGGESKPEWDAILCLVTLLIGLKYHLSTMSGNVFVLSLFYMGLILKEYADDLMEMAVATEVWKYLLLAYLLKAAHSSLDLFLGLARCAKAFKKMVP